MTDWTIVLLISAVGLVYIYFFKQLQRKNANLPMIVIYILGFIYLIAGVLALPFLLVIATCKWLGEILTGESSITDKGE